MKNLRTNLIKIFFTLIILIAFNISCGDKNTVVPHVYVHFELDLNQADMQDLISIGGYVFVTGGHRGIVIYHNSVDEFSAYNRSCTYHPNEECRVGDSDKWGTLICDCCDSEYFLFNDAIPIKEPATIALQKYRVTYNQGAQILTVTNY